MSMRSSRLIVVLGMHRSGTSAVTRGLKVLGVDLGETLYGALPKVNERGFWEDVHLNALDVEMLSSLDSDWHSLAPIENDDVEKLRDSGYFLRAVELLRQKVCGRPIFGFKDPRVAKLLLFWKDVFKFCQLDVSYVLAVRHPLSVVKSLARRDGFDAEKSYLLWLGHVIRSLKDGDGKRRVLVDYDLLMHSPDNELGRIAKQLELNINHDELKIYKTEFLDKSLQHTVYGVKDLSLDDSCPPLVREVYATVLDVASDKLQMDDPEFLKRIEHWEVEFERLYALLRLTDRLYTEKATVFQELAEREGQIASLNQAVVERDGQIAGLNQEVAERNGEITSLSQAVVERDGWLAEYSRQVNALENSRSWRITAPFRWLGLLVRRRTDVKDTLLRATDSGEKLTESQYSSGFASWRRRAAYLSSRYRQGVKRHGLLRSIPFAIRASSALTSAWISKRFRHNTYDRKLQQLKQIIVGHHNFVDLFHVPMGWSTPLFQRFQHMSLQSAKLGGLALYGGHLQVDKDLFVFKRAEGNVIVFDALDDQVVQCVFDALKHVGHPKILRLQSIDLATRIEDVERFLSEGLTVVYEYIDEISEEITGSIPEFVIERHRWLLEKPQVFVVATSDKLFDEVRKHRERGCLLSTNGVDLAHWRKKIDRPPTDMEPALASGRIVVGYHGALANWIDYELLRQIADDGSYELVLIGYEHDSSMADSGVLEHTNVHFLGSKSYFDLNEYAAFYDVAILPFKRYALTESVSPVKLFEYMAAGKPVVTTDLAECLKYESCLVSDSNASFLRNLHIATGARNDDKYKAILRYDAEQNSWLEKASAAFQLAGVEIRA